MTRLLLIDDDEHFCKSLTTYLEKFEFSVSSVHSGLAAIDVLKQRLPDLVILDYMLPDNLDGLAVCREVKALYPPLPILMLSARGDPSDKIVGLEMGADDYLSKPFEPRELVARIKAILRRGQGRTPSTQPSRYLNCGELELDLFTKSASLNTHDIGLTSAEYALLEEFAKQPGKVFNRDELSRALRGIDWHATDRSLDIIVSKLRQKLKDDLKNPRFIKTVWGSGYMFIGSPRS